MRRPSRFPGALLGLAMLSLWGCDGRFGDAVATPAPAEETAEPEGQRGDAKTRHDGRPANRLAREISPYLLLHAHNPVDWYPWGPEAFEKARQEDKPIFLSIGYSSCHWCHVMERRVFSDKEIARYMNEHFVNIKVDREERPDVDDIYMTALHVYLQLAGSPQGGGWPLSMFLTPGGKPFAGGTYFPPKGQHGQPGFPSVMERVVNLWEEKRDDLENNAEIITAEVRRLMRPEFALSKAELARALATDAAESVIETHDAQHGGVDFDPSNADAPKFPVPVKLGLLQYAARGRDNAEAERILLHTLDGIAAGGIHDHLGGGFHRYSTDRRWHVPHFEKMLYDQSQLADVYVEAYRRSGRPRYREVAEATFAFVLRAMTDPQGGFYSALDAETDGIEGKYYVWSSEEIEQRLGGENADLFRAVYGLEEPQVFEHGYVLHLPRPVAAAAERLDIPLAQLKDRLAVMRRTLLEARQEREPVRLDDKILASWNGLMIRALAHGGEALQRADYIEAAENAAIFILSQMRDDRGRLKRSYRAGAVSLNAYLDDYAFIIEGLLALHKATGEERWLNAAQRLNDQQIELFWDEQGHGFFFTAHDQESLIARTKNAFDSVLPSGNSVSVRNLIRLDSLTDHANYRDYARRTLELFAPKLRQAPRSMTNMAVALGEFLDGADSDRGPRHESEPSESAKGHGVLQVAAESPQSNNGQAPMVAAKVYLSHDRLPAGGESRIAVRLTIREGWHINANPANPDFLIPTTITLKSKNGTNLGKLSYPPGTQLRIEGFDEPLTVYEEHVVIRGVVEVPGDVASDAEDLQLRVRYQACDDAQCLAPTSITLNGKIPVARSGEPVRRINAKLFPPVRKR